MLSEQHDYVVGKLKRQQGFFKFLIIKKLYNYIYIYIYTLKPNLTSKQNNKKEP